ncbi:ABC transporter permease [[Mycoplasma] mobile]|uniref:Oligopeptide ABC transporter permease protein n=1 Tax=Mycoplasma mobile (strain ATCC 43663 / 163K / NCTC 11711) TaxID=267748 RepID=Q6KHJ3_MYCM1|nr:ABC transporter permease [[Mycoplasma] mobile]AAT27937.1 oligopeptide ABC transporter permease protein [Mycoplasma mobile 163K]
MFKYISIRIFLGTIALFVILILTYLLIGSFGANPFFATATNAQQAEEAFIAAGLNRPIGARLAEWLGGFFLGDFRVGFGAQFSGRTIPEIFFGPMLFTLAIAGPAFLISVIVGIALGVWSGYRRGTYIDASINLFTRIFIALPSFILAPFFILFGLLIGLPTRFASAAEGASSGLVIASTVLPILVLVFGSLAAYVTYARNETTRVLSSNYILIAKSKGLKSYEIFLKYVLKNISIPLMSLIIPSFIFLLSGSLIVESFFAVPGTSVLFINAFPNGEINIVMFSTFFFATLTIASRILVDIVSILLDPRIKFATKNPYGIYPIIKSYEARKRELKNNSEFTKMGKDLQNE